jgi:signal transduction histidine kinase
MAGSLRRAVLLEWVSRWVETRPKQSDRRDRIDAIVVAVSVAVIVLIGMADYLSGAVLSLVLFYMIPISITTVVAGRAAGLWLSLESAAVATIAELARTSNRRDQAIYVIDGFLLIAIFAFVVILLAAVRQSALAAHESSQRTRQFLASAAHQLRTPVAGIRASTDALLVTGATSQQERLLANIAGESDRAGRLLGSLLRMARLDQGELYPVQAHDVVALCQAEVDRLRPRAGHLRLELAVTRPPLVPVLLSGEAARDALANLLDNARRHATTSITVTVTIEGLQETIEIAVEDDGPGLPPAQAEQAFERFVSLDGRGGSGLGLPIARAMIEAQGGRLTYEEHRFVIRLPLRLAQRGARTVNTRDDRHVSRDRRK